MNLTAAGSRRCGSCRRRRELVAFLETEPWGEVRLVCAACRDRLVDVQVRYFVQVDKATRTARAGRESSS